MRHFEILIIGGGAAGMAAALAAEKKGYHHILIVERNEYLGGILMQCTHKGFGLGYFREDLTGTEYAERFAALLAESQERSDNIEIMCSTMVLKLYPDRCALLSGRYGTEMISFERCIMATGCKERTIFSQIVSGTRPAGIMTCGTAQKLINIDHLDIGDDIVILGTGDVGQIMARQLIQSGKNVIAMIEQSSALGGLKRNQENCILAYSIPVMLNSEITQICGSGRIEGVRVLHHDTDQEEYIPCSVLLTAIGMIPEKELAGESFVQTPLPEWLYFTGNSDYVHDIVDSVTTDAFKLIDEL